MSLRRRACAGFAIGLGLLLAACIPAASPSGLASARASTGAGVSARKPTSCGSQAPEALADAAGAVGIRIYRNETGGSETLSDRRQIETYTPLLSAMANGDRTATEQAVDTLVFSHTHIVRLRVVHQGSVFADIGGPYILAPVTGTLHYKGQAVGRYVMSVQDDLGYVKLVSRLIGVPLALRSGSQTIPVQGVVAPGLASIPDHGPVHYKGAVYQAFSFDARAFPSAPLRVSLLVPIPGGLAAKSCTQIRAEELSYVAQRISRRFALALAVFPTYVKLVRNLTGGLVYIRIGNRQLAGSSPRGPRRLPDSGPVKYRGSTWEASSFTAPSSAGEVRVYLIVPR